MPTTSTPKGVAHSLSNCPSFASRSYCCRCLVISRCTCASFSCLSCISRSSSLAKRPLPPAEKDQIKQSRTLHGCCLRLTLCVLQHKLLQLTKAFDLTQAMFRHGASAHAAHAKAAIVLKLMPRADSQGYKVLSSPWQSLWLICHAALSRSTC